VTNDQEDHRRRLATLDRQEVDRFGRTFEELFYRGDAATMAAFYVEDAEVMAPNADLVQGRRAIEAFFTVASQRTGMNEPSKVPQVERSGDLGDVLSTVILEIPVAGERVTTSTFNDFTVRKPEDDAGRRVVVDSANRTAPPEPPPTRAQPQG
jgi:ketosteroid isomerase-like protein